MIGRKIAAGFRDCLPSVRLGAIEGKPSKSMFGNLHKGLILNNETYGMNFDYVII